MKTAGSARIVREWEALEKMAHLYCHRKHVSQGEGLCQDCRQLLDCFKLHLDGCRFGTKKPVCTTCCYFHGCNPKYWERVESIIQATALQMLLRNPGSTLRHWVDHLHRAPADVALINYPCWGME